MLARSIIRPFGSRRILRPWSIIKSSREDLPPITNDLAFLLDTTKSVVPVFSAAGTTGPSTQTVDADGTHFNEAGAIEQNVANKLYCGRYQKGGLIQPTRANIGIKCHDFTNAAWEISEAEEDTPDLTVLNTAVVCKDGASRTTNVIRCDVADGSIMQTVTSASAAHSCGFWIKRITGSGAVNITIDGGTHWTAVTVTSAWTRVKKENVTVENPQFGIQMHVKDDVIALDFGQLEVGAALSSDIPTTTAAVTRTADSLVYPVSVAMPFTLMVLHTFRAPPAALGNNYIASIEKTGTTPYGMFYWYRTGPVFSSDLVVSAGNNGQVVGTTTAAIDVPHVLCMTVAENSMKNYYNGVAEGATDTSVSADAGVFDKLHIGQYTNGTAQTLGNVGAAILWNRVLSADEVLAVSNWLHAKVGAL
jgi:hypothetical protein